MKYGDRPHYEWVTNVLVRRPTFVICYGPPGRPLLHYTKQKTFVADNWSVEFFSTEEWFTVSIDIVAGEIRQHYCNIAEPARLVDGVLSFVDLDLDLVRRTGNDWMVVDEDDLERNASRFGYPASLVATARMELAQLRARIDNCGFPFDGTLEPYVAKVAVESLRPETL